jgi:hypothetical protein
MQMTEDVLSGIHRGAVWQSQKRNNVQSPGESTADVGECLRYCCCYLEYALFDKLMLGLNKRARSK